MDRGATHSEEKNDLRAIQEGAAHIESSGERYPAEHQRLIDR
ncbi:MAG TPA: hypothetical protein VG937_30960 [Polyangiaceae bacterium]|nr:hypothetical protein [Polyangiaceae bacterium]